MAIRCLDGSYAAGGSRAALIPIASRPAFTPAAGVLGGLNMKSLVLVSMLATTFLAHYNAPKFFTELKNPASGAGIYIYIYLSLYIYIYRDIERERCWPPPSWHTATRLSSSRSSRTQSPVRAYTYIYLSISVYIYIFIYIDIYIERDADHHLPGTLQRAKVLHRAQEPRLRCGHIHRYIYLSLYTYIYIYIYIYIYMCV